MVPRTEVIAVDSTASLDEVTERLEQTNHTRYPVFDRRPGPHPRVLDAKDLLNARAGGPERLARLVQPAVAIPESVSVEVAVQAMRAKQVQIVVHRG